MSNKHFRCPICDKLILFKDEIDVHCYSEHAHSADYLEGYEEAKQELFHQTPELREKIFIILLESYLEYDDAIRATDDILSLLSPEKSAHDKDVTRKAPQNEKECDCVCHCIPSEKCTHKHTVYGCEHSLRRW